MAHSKGTLYATYSLSRSRRSGDEDGEPYCRLRGLCRGICRPGRARVRRRTSWRPDGRFYPYSSSTHPGARGYHVSRSGRRGRRYPPHRASCQVLAQTTYSYTSVKERGTALLERCCERVKG